MKLLINLDVYYMNVKIYNEKDSMSKRRQIIPPGDFRIDKFENGLYTVKNLKNNKTQLIPRYRLALRNDEFPRQDCLCS